MEEELGPRKRCDVIAKAGVMRESLLDEAGQRSMVDAIKGSY